jgi:ATP-dependent Lon protease
VNLPGRGGGGMRNSRTSVDIEHNENFKQADSEHGSGELVRASELLPDVIPILPEERRPVFPGQLIPLVVPDKWETTIKAAMESEHKVIGLLLIKTEAAEQPGPDDLYSSGTACRIHRAMRAEGRLQVLIQGLQRFSVDKWISEKVPYRARVHYQLERVSRPESEIKAYAVAIINVIKELVPLNPLYGEELKVFLENFSPNEPSRLADFAASMTTASKAELQNVLQTHSLLPRLEKVIVLIRKELEIARAQAKIHEKVEQEIHGRQREVFLREQLKAIQQELGLSKDDRTAEQDRFRDRLKDLTLSDKAQKRIDEEMEKLGLLETGSPEYSVTRNYLDWLTALPWGRYTEDYIDLNEARAVLDQDHEGLEEVKERIIEFLAVAEMKGEVSGSILLFVGPPGVGKTSLGRSIAAALGREFFRFSLGGMRDEAEIKGHRRTYIGAMPGKFIQAIKDTGSANPVIMLDELDKVGASYHGDPASALLEVLDPEQNAGFLDHYIDVPFDLSKVLFIATANQLDTIPAPLLDRTEIIRLSGYLTEEKLDIAQKHLIPRQLERAGLTRKDLRITRSALRRIIEGYAREAGVRKLEKRIGAVVRKAVVQILEGATKPVRVGSDSLEEYLGKPEFKASRLVGGVGVSTGLAWTALGGTIMNIEANRVHSSGRGMTLTGQLGEVMQESATIAYSHIVSNAEKYGVKSDYFDNAQVHLHVPAGATPKDGPSAGITMASAFLSLARQRRIRNKLAMTGELTLTGQVLPVGGVREKLVAARRAGMKEVILPEANQGDFEEIPEYIRRNLSVHFVETFRDVVELLFPSRA